MPGLVPSPDLRNLCLQLKQLTAPELAYVRHYLAQILGDEDEDDEPSGGVREPRRPIPPTGTSSILLDFNPDVATPADTVDT